MNNKAISTWHEIVETKSMSSLDEVLADDVVFHSPVVHTPQVGKAVTQLYLTAAFDVLLNESFRYVRGIINNEDAELEFIAEVDGIVVNGVDLITWNDEGRIVDFKVMLRPLKAINLIHEMMAAKLESLN